MKYDIIMKMIIIMGCFFMNGSMLIEHCSPTLAGLKVGNIFNCSFANDEDVSRFLAYWNDRLNDKGVYLSKLNRRKDKVNIYVYRKNKLSELLADDDIRAFLDCYGYEEFDIPYVISRLRDRLAEDGFPHEIGVVLGYPLSDIKGFIANGGRNFKCLGCWKVYDDEKKAIKTFRCFNHCKEVYKKHYNKGVDITRLAVAI